MVQIGIVGSGFMAETHVDAYENIDGADVVAVASPNTADEFVAKHGLDATAYDSAESLFGDDAVEAVDICTPTPTHRPLVETAADRGLDVFCEKPIAGSLADANAIADAVDDANSTFMVGHVLRFFPQYAAIREEVESGAIGTPGTGRARRLSPFPEWGQDDWYADRSRSGGTLLDLAIHDFDYLRWLFGEVERVFARTANWERGEHSHATLRFADGAVGYVEAAWAKPPEGELTSTLELAGDDGLIEFDSADATPVRVSSDDGTVTEPPVENGGYRRELREFVSCVERGREPSVTVNDAIAALRISLAAKRSAEEGRPVPMQEVVA